MALVLGDNFSYGGAKPLDARLTYNTLAQMKAVADATMYDGCMAYCVETDKTYQWKSTNTVDENTGRWREFSSGGSTGGGHTIEDSEGTDLTQRDTLQFGEGFKAEDDDTNEKTVISPDIMQSGDMDEVITPLPSVAPKKEGIKYSTTEQVIGEWIDGKPLYQKTVSCGALPNTATEYNPKKVAHNITNLDTTVNFWGIAINPNTHASCKLGGLGTNSDTSSDLGLFIDSIHVNIKTSADRSAYSESYVTIQYTKTTDTPNT